MVKFHQALSDQSVDLRYFQPLKLSQRVAHERLARICYIDYDREMALVVDRHDPKTGEYEILGAARLTKIHRTDEAAFSILISDPYQRPGLGTELLRRLLQIGRDEGLKRIRADILREDTAMQQVCKKLGFKLHHKVDDPMVTTDHSF